MSSGGEEGGAGPREERRRARQLKPGPFGNRNVETGIMEVCDWKRQDAAAGLVLGIVDREGAVHVGVYGRVSNEQLEQMGVEVLHRIMDRRRGG
jgi:hypothetical protein